MALSVRQFVSQKSTYEVYIEKCTQKSVQKNYTESTDKVCPQVWIKAHIKSTFLPNAKCISAFRTMSKKIKSQQE